MVDDGGQQDTTNIFPIGSFITYIPNPTYVYKIYDFVKQQNKYYLTLIPELGAENIFEKEMVETNFRVSTISEMALYGTRPVPANKVRQT